MYIDTRDIHPDYNSSLDAVQKSMIAMGGAWNTSTNILPTINDIKDPWEHMQQIDARLKKLETENKFLKLKLLGMEGKFSQDEIKNIRAMLMSNDESSITLAETIIETA
jgi:hypothetical protein